jgi:hypothetical protein
MKIMRVKVPFEIRPAGLPKRLPAETEWRFRLTDPEGASLTLPAFRTADGGVVGRLVSDRAGVHEWRLLREGDETPVRTGSIRLWPGSSADRRSRPCQPGRLRVAAGSQTLEDARGRPFLWMGDTWWFGSTRRLDWPHGFRRLADDRVAKGFNVIQICAGPQPDCDGVDNPFDLQQANEGGLPWFPKWRGINAGYYDALDRRIACLVERGLVPCVVGMWGYFLPVMGVERVRRHWRNLVARYAAYPVVWCVAGEANMPTYSTNFAGGAAAAADRAAQEQGWTEIARYLRELDPYRNPITVHPSHPDSKAMLRDAALLDIDMLQTGHGGQGVLKPSVETLRACRDSAPRLPTLIGEVNYEGIMGGSGPEVQRFLVWASLLEGACGFTYGAQGVWQMSTRRRPHRGYTGEWGEGFWPEAMHRPGAGQVGHARRLFERFDWPRFTPRGEPRAAERKRVSALACGIPGQVAVFYLPANCLPEEVMGMNDSWFGGSLDIAIEAGAHYTAWWFDPRTGAAVRSYRTRGGRTVKMGPVQPRPDGYWTPPLKPTMEDWVLVLEAK